MGYKRGLLNQFYRSISKSSKQTLIMLKLKHTFVIFDKIGEKLLNWATYVVYHPKYWGNEHFLSVGGLKYFKETKKVNPGKSLKLKCIKGWIKLSINGLKFWFTIMLNSSWLWIIVVQHNSCWGSFFCRTVFGANSKSNCLCFVK